MTIPSVTGDVSASTRPVASGAAAIDDVVGQHRPVVLVARGGSSSQGEHAARADPVGEFRCRGPGQVRSGQVANAISVQRAFGNLLLGVPFELNEYLRPTYTGSFWGLLNPFALLCGVVSLFMLVMHGAVWLQMRCQETIADRARGAVQLSAIVVIVVSVIGLAIAVSSATQDINIDALRIEQVENTGGTPTGSCDRTPYPEGFAEYVTGGDGGNVVTVTVADAEDSAVAKLVNRILVDAIKRNERLSFQNTFRNVDVLLIDDIQFFGFKIRKFKLIIIDVHLHVFTYHRYTVFCPVSS